MGWSIKREELPYLLCYYEEPEKCRALIEESDVVVFGGVEDESYIEKRLEEGKPVIRYSERLYREGQWKAISPRGLIKKYHDHTRHREKKVYLLCAGAFTASDFTIVRAYPGKMYKWGYFTELADYDIEDLMNKKDIKEKPEILFAGRFIPLKHPEYPLMLAKRLKEKNIPFHLTMVGGGELEESLKEQADSDNLDDCVDFPGFKAPSEVRKYMERADVFIMSSNHLEGWGAVIPEAMNSGCAVLAGSKIGAVPFLIKHGINGMVYREGEKEQFLDFGEWLITHHKERCEIGTRAFETITNLWNPGFAGESLIRFAKGLLKGELVTNSEGPLSPAPVIWPHQGYEYVRKADDK